MTLTQSPRIDSGERRGASGAGPGRRNRRRLPLPLAVVLILALGMVLALFATRGGHWVASGDTPLEEVDGFLFDGERPCSLPPTGDCAVPVAAAQWLLDPEDRAATTAAAFGILPSVYVDGDGPLHTSTYAGLTRAYAVILDIAGRGRRVFLINCMPPVQQGTVITPERCWSEPTDGLPRAPLHLPFLP